MNTLCESKKPIMPLNKTSTSIAIALFLLITIAFALVSLPSPTANAATTKQTYAFIGAVPNPVGVNQETLLNVGITYYVGMLGDGWKGLSVTILKPSGETETINNINTDSTGATGVIYVPDEVGTYILQSHFPEQDFGGVTYKASVSDTLTLIVQSEPIEYTPGHALPTEYWSRPIDSQLREWYTISGNWLYTPDNRYAPYNDDAPNTPHILWTKELTYGGLTGGGVGLNDSINNGPVGMNFGDAYEGKWTSRFILNGHLYYTMDTKSSVSATLLKPVVYHCVDLHTGEEQWARTFLDNQSIAFGQQLYWQTFNNMGTFDYLWVTVGSSWYAFDAYTGNWQFTIYNVPSGTTLTNQNGALYILQTDLIHGWIAQWNMTTLCTYSTSAFSEGNWGNSVLMKTFDAAANTTAAKLAWDFNVSIPTGTTGSVVATYFNDRIIGSNIGTSFISAIAPNTVNVWGISLKDGSQGTTLFNASWNAPSAWIDGNQTMRWAAFSQDDKVGILWCKEVRQHYGVSLETGELLWGPSESQNFLDNYEGFASSHLIAYGKLYAGEVSGTMYCYDITTGDLLWNYNATEYYTDYLYSNNWWVRPCFFTDGKLYMGHVESTPNQPLPRNAPFICLNATTGEVIWRADGLFHQSEFGGLAIIGDSIMAARDIYDDRLYAVGKGPSATTVTAPDIGLPLGKSVLIRGMVTDVSPGTNDAVLAMRFPNGVPAVSDANMTDWMLYVYKQFEKPADTVGVEVIVSVLDPNNNCYEVARTTSDASGFFSAEFEPEVPGKYTIFATFAGSGAYYGSSAETAINVEEAPAATPEPTPTPASAADLYFLPVSAGMIIAIVIVLALLVLMMLRKR